MARGLCSVTSSTTIAGLMKVFDTRCQPSTFVSSSHAHTQSPTATSSMGHQPFRNKDGCARDEATSHRESRSDARFRFDQPREFRGHDDRSPLDDATYHLPRDKGEPLKLRRVR